ncbi:phospholipid-translocating P-type ATPase [Haematococcus lacustris]|uniref:Phospholipid-translocating P-type ATPase n=1 Tax=Haematococcus lacustris TaxID=44745 RepID=A0A699YUG5_HAELA|nr:phospholipid-translocating P-type ATPase [Haematococcus lacustris]
MSVVIRAPNGRLVAFVKGADSAMLPLLRPDTPEEVLEATQRDLSFFATQGLRTLVVGARQLDPAWYARWDEGYQSAAAALHDRDEKVSAAALELEKELELPGPPYP